MKGIEGKLFGAALGFSFGGPIGAIIGAAVGHLFDSSVKTHTVRGKAGARRELTFITSLILLLTGTARADGSVTPQEITTIKNFFSTQLGYRNAEMHFIEHLLQESIRKETNLDEVCQEINTRTSYEERLFLIQLNYQVAFADGRLTRAEDAYIEQAARLLGIEPYDLKMIRNSFHYSSSSFSTSAREGWRKDPYAILGVSPNCNDDELHRAYRSMVSKYHPDKVSHLGQEFIELANRKFTEIQKAYETIKKERCIE